MLDASDTACAMEEEDSSHALELHPADAIYFAAAIFANLTQDHLDFHPTMDDYFNAKRRLFGTPDQSPAIVNVDDAYGARLASELDSPVTFAIDDR
jgi:UDP-N-acetylmuramoyl-L-alanyl-D-glutamate--2,6-diaminopimelate ligase